MNKTDSLALDITFIIHDRVILLHSGKDAYFSSKSCLAYQVISIVEYL